MSAHVPVCAECGQPWPCRPQLEQRNRHDVGAAIVGNKVRFEMRMGEPMMVVGEHGGVLPADDPEVIEMLTAIGYTVEIDKRGHVTGFTYGP